MRSDAKFVAMHHTWIIANRTRFTEYSVHAFFADSSFTKEVFLCPGSRRKT